MPNGNIRSHAGGLAHHKEIGMTAQIFSGVIPALMTPCLPDRTPDIPALVRKARFLIAQGMSAVVYCGSMGDWPLLSDMPPTPI